MVTMEFLYEWWSYVTWQLLNLYQLYIKIVWTFSRWLEKGNIIPVHKKTLSKLFQMTEKS